ncbi:unnamed protein product [Echinostoma caproni]|uniref:Uncharacterized protein n=1 Tax=Echinostoma caproni TaxID=27848 RepID=A0A183AMC9_9TREM|nr:unnamed protein product [Echinostoma caproni]
MPICNLSDPDIPMADENSSPTYKLQTTEPNIQFVFAPLMFESAVEHRFIMDTENSGSTLRNSELTAIRHNAVLTLTSVLTHQLQLLGETMFCIQSEAGVSIPIRFLVSDHISSILGPRVVGLQQGSTTPHTSNDKPHLTSATIDCTM